MIARIRQWPLRDRLGLYTLAPMFLLLALLLFFAPDGVQRSDWAQFTGGFHLLTIHFPIALIFLIPALELAARSRRFPGLRASIEPLLALAVFSALTSAILGWFLARSGGSAGPLVVQHMWAGFLVSLCCWGCWMLRGRFAVRRFRIAYLSCLAVTVILIAFTGYRGGQLSHGEAHLTEHLPSPVRDWLGGSKQRGPTVATPESLFTIRVEPVLAENCVSCHGPSRQKGNLRLDSYEAVMRGGKSGQVVKAGDLNGSELFQRVSHAAGSEKIMPPQGKPPLAADQIKLIEVWISAGASPSLAATAVSGGAGAVRRAAEVSIPEIDDAAVAKQRASFAAALAELSKRYPDMIEYESRGSAKLAMNASLLGGRFGDDDLAQLKPLYDHFVTADFSNTAITDRSASNLAAMKHLRKLSLMHTKITDATVLSLGGLNEVESLNVFGTGITPAALKAAEHMADLQHLYAGETSIPTNSSLPDAIRGKVQF